MPDLETIKHTPKLWERHIEAGSESDWLFWCPGCKCGHLFSVPRWSFDGNVHAPTFAPSLLLFTTSPIDGSKATVCHLNVTAGQIIYHGDCPHQLKGQTIPMQDLPPNYGF